jgi:cytidyltransferase-like protein
MLNSFKKVFETVLKEVNVKNIGIFPGKFKPPHAGHFKTCMSACNENDVVFVLISNKEHEGVTPEMSFNIWNIYGRHLKSSHPFIVTPTPVLGCYELINILNNGDYVSDSNSPKSNIQELISSSKVLESFINVGNNLNINLYSSPEDVQRFRNVNSELYKGKNIIDIKFKQVARLTSASKFREALKSNTDVDKFLPNVLSAEEKQEVLNILNGTV